jgi:hypothetical protein
MSLQIDEALRDGFNRTVARSGLLLVGVFLVFGLGNAVISQSFSQELTTVLEQTANQNIATGQTPLVGDNTQPTPFAVSLSLEVLGLLSVLVAVVAEALTIVAVRVFASDYTESIPGHLVSRRIALATINGVVGGLIALVLIVLGAIFFVVPGIYAAISLLFVRQEIAVDDKNFVDALGDSWSLTAGNRWEVLGLAIIVIVINLVAGSPGLVLGFLDPTVGALASVVISSFTGVFATAVTTRAYQQLRRGREARDGPDDSTPSSTGPV